MYVVLSADAEGMPLKDIVVKHLREKGYEVRDLAETPAKNPVAAAKAVSEVLLKDEAARGFLFDKYGAASFMAACKIKGIIACECSDERSAFMTREHNNARLITMGAAIVGPLLACEIAEQFLQADYAGGRHQIRVDMLNRMA